MSGKKLRYGFAQRNVISKKASGNKSVRNKSIIRLLKLPAITASAVSTMFLPENPNELCDRIKFLLHEKQAGNNTNISDDEIVAIADILLEHKCISTKQHNFLFLECLN